MSVFNIDVNENDDLFLLKISGELRRGKDLSQSPKLLEVLNKADSISKTKLVIFNLQDLDYWDTEGITKIVSLVKKINELNPHRSGMIAPKDKLLIEHASKKFADIGTSLIPISSDVESLIEKLTE